MAKIKKITFEEYLSLDDGTNKRYELVDGKLVEMPPASFKQSDIIDFIADCFKAIASPTFPELKLTATEIWSA